MSKVITLEIPDPLSQWLEEEAQVRGVNPGELVLEYVNTMAEETRRRKGRKRKELSAEEEIARFGVYPMGTFEPLTRGELYGDR